MTDGMEHHGKPFHLQKTSTLVFITSTAASCGLSSEKLDSHIYLLLRELGKHKGRPKGGEKIKKEITGLKFSLVYLPRLPSRREEEPLAFCCRNFCAFPTGARSINR